MDGKTKDDSLDSGIREQAALVKQCLAKNRPVNDEQCPKEATVALRLEFRALIWTDPDVAFLNIKVCDEHKLPDEEVKEFLRLNWETMMAGFDLVKREPDPRFTKWSWVPLTEAEKFWEEGESSPNKRTSYKQ